MPLTNGDAGTSTAQLTPGKSSLDYATALDVLGQEDRDGIDVQTLLDSKAHGGLTYNDFLILPGYIGMEHSKGRGLCHKYEADMRIQASLLPTSRLILL